jgi:Ca-activated chloride channel family protein
MSTVTFDNLNWLHLLWAALGVALIGVYGVWRRQLALRRFAAVALLPRLTAGVSWTRALVRLALIVTGLMALVAALIGPRWGEQTQTLLRRNVDVMILLDVSRSMLARDIAPSRLERAKLAIRDDLLPSLGGDRVGLLAFAGTATLVCPLTSDYGFFRLALDDVNTHSTPRGGTLIGDAIRRAGGLFAEDKVESHRVILLITDGEDHESFPVEAAASVWKDAEIPLIALALGDPEQGARVPEGEAAGDKYLEHQGEVVRSRADFSTLDQVAHASPQGVFVAVGTSNFDLGDIYSRVVKSIRVAEDREQRQVRQPLQAHPFVVLALLLVLVDSFLRDGRQRAASADPRFGRSLQRMSAVLLLAILPATLRAESPRELIQKGNADYAAGRYAEALKSYQQASAAAAGQTPEVLHDLAAAQFKLGQIDDARDLWTRIKESGDAAFEARTRYNLGNCDYAEALSLGPQDAKKALAKLAEAAQQYRAALRLDPTNADARANLELTQRLKQQIEEQQKNQQQSPSSQPQSQPSDPNQQPSTQPSQPQSQPSQKPESQPSESSQSQPAQQDQKQQSSADQQDPNQAQSQPAQQEDEEQEDRESQKKPEEQPAESQPAAATQPTPVTTQPAGEPQEGEPKATLLPREQAERLLQMIRDAEKARREKLARDRAAKQKPVDRDW